MKKEIEKSLVKLGTEIIKDIDSEQFPRMELPLRTGSNIIYDKKLRQYVLGGAKQIRSAGSIAHVRSFAQTVWTASFVKEMLQKDKTATLRDTYYSANGHGIDYNEQSESDKIIEDVEALLGVPREAMHINPEERSSVFGDLTIEFTERKFKGRRISLNTHPDGFMIGPSLSTARFVGCRARMVLAVEKGGVFTRFVEDGVPEKYKAMIIDLGGQAPRNTRLLLRRMSEELKLPVYVLTDGNAWGAHIASVIIFGSISASHLRGLAVPDAQWIGLWPKDIEQYKLPTDPFTEQDWKRLKELKGDPRYKTGVWKQALEDWTKLGRKADLEAFAKYGIEFITEKYLPEKLREIEKEKARVSKKQSSAGSA